MTPQAAIVPDADADSRWRNWQARGVARDRRTATRSRGLMLLVAAALVGWFVLQLM